LDAPFAGQRANSPIAQGLAICGYKSSQLGFASSTSRIFHARFHFFNLFSLDSGLDVGMPFKVDKPLDAILLCKAGRELQPMFIDSPNQIIRHADVKRPANPAREDADPIAAFSAHCARSAITGSSACADDDSEIGR
jgi:hypothetical protein